MVKDHSSTNHKLMKIAEVISVALTYDHRIVDGLCCSCDEQRKQLKFQPGS
jgi:pyruvate/2-oxoglutarate dehydrogenase complex dihydrolipoamide acyltransferase (E2) component